MIQKNTDIRIRNNANALIDRSQKNEFNTYKNIFISAIEDFGKNAANAYIPLLLSANFKNLKNAKNNIVNKLCDNGFSKEIPKVKETFDFVETIYKHRLRKDQKTKAVSHPIKIALNCAYAGCDSDTIIVALLHDTLEDGLCTYHEISKKFGIKIADSVVHITDYQREEFYRKLAEIETTSHLDNDMKLTLKKEYYKKYLEKLYYSGDLRSIIIKFFDTFENSKSLEFETDELLKTSITEKALLHLPFWKAINYKMFELVKTTLENNCPEKLRTKVSGMSKKSFSQIAYEKVGVAFINTLNPFSYNAILQKPESYSGISTVYIPTSLDTNTDGIILEFPNDMPKDIVLKKCQQILPMFDWEHIETNPLPKYLMSSNFFMASRLDKSQYAEQESEKDLYNLFCFLAKTLQTEYIILKTERIEHGI